MKKKFWLFAVMSCAIAGSVAVLQISQQKTTADIVCHTAGSKEPKVAVLVIGESWAAGGRLLPEMADAIYKRLESGSVKVCTAGYSGRNALQISNAVRSDLSNEKVSELVKEYELRNIVILAGINDIIQHTGKVSYVNGVKGIAEKWPNLKVEATEIPRVIETGVPSGIASQTKRFLQRHFFDDGKHEVIDTYRSALVDTNISIISYDNFIPSYLGNESSYAPDGIHLTLDMYHSYGKYLGSQIDLN